MAQPDLAERSAGLLVGDEPASSVMKVKMVLLPFRRFTNGLFAWM